MRHWFSAAAVLVVSSTVSLPASIPLPEHPRPDFQREEWVNLNGPWQFQFDPPDAGETQGWFRSGLPAARQILVPFPWGSPLSGVPDSATPPSAGTLEGSTCRPRGRQAPGVSSS
jgi:hypothetical protein